MAVFALSVIASIQARADEPTVSYSVFAASVVDRSPQHPISSDGAAAPGPVWFFTTIVAPESTLEELRRSGRLPLKHRWYREVGGGLYDPHRPDFEKDLDIGTVADLASLENEVALRHGVYDWRTTSCRDLTIGTYRVQVTDRNGRPLACREGGNCGFEVRVTLSGVPGSICRGH